MRSLRFLAVFLFAFLFLLVSGASVHQNQKRATQVSLTSVSYSNNVLSGQISIQNLAPTKVVTINWTSSSSWSSTQSFAAQWVSGPDSTGYEVWSFSGTAAGALQYYIQYTVNGVSYYDPGNNVNYNVPSSGSSSAMGSTSASSTAVGSTSISTTSVSTTTTPVASPTGTSIPAVSLPPIVPTSIPSEAPAAAPSGCGTFNGKESCTSDAVFDMPAAAENRRWQTPPEGNTAYSSSFQDYSDLVGYADIQYNPARNAALVTVNAASKTGEQLSYSFGGTAQTSNSFRVDSSLTGSLAITVSSSSGKTLGLEPLNFIWQNVALTAAQSTFSNGQKGAIAELFGWPYNDIAKECVFLGKAGYMGIKIWSPNEHVWGSNLYEADNQFRPWYLVYQPVSYRLTSRHGTRAELRAMINACRAAGVRVYADAVINHMSGNGNDIQNHRTDACVYYPGHNATDNSPYFTTGNTFLINPFTNNRPALEFPAVPYGPTDFHCERSIGDWNSGQIVTKGWLVGLTDLNTEKAYVQDRIATYLADLLSIGFSGFRVDAAKHIGPTSQAQIFGRLAAKMGGSLPADFVSWLEVLIGGEKDLLACSGGEWSWYTNFNTRLSAAGLSATDIEKIKIWSADYPKEFPICGSWIIPASRFAIQNDDHDQQGEGSSSRDMGDQGSVLVKDKDIAKHRSFETLLFSRTDADWRIKLVLSSWVFADNGANGFPDGLSDCATQYTGTQSLTTCKGVVKDPAYVAAACGYTSLAGGKYTRVHRDISIVNAMRAWVGLGSTTAAALGISGCS